MNTLSRLIGATVLKVEGAEEQSEEVKIITDLGTLRLYHEQSCCESVCVEDVVGDPADLIGGVVVLFEERDNDSEEKGEYESSTWTFYALRTTKGDLDLRWLGTSNGFYSESVHTEWIPKEQA